MFPNLNEFSTIYQIEVTESKDQKLKAPKHVSSISILCELLFRNRKERTFIAIVIRNRPRYDTVDDLKFPT